MRYLVVLLTLFVTTALAGPRNYQAKGEDPVIRSSGLGNVNHPVSTTSAEAQSLFNQGLAYIYGFNHAEAERSFKRAAEVDPQLGMAYWGVALALGSNYNLQADAPQLQDAYANLQKALALSAKASNRDRAYIEALAKRYSADPAADRQMLAVEYRKAMGELVKRFPDDLDAATLYAESMMNLRPWKLWTPDGKPAEGTEEIVRVLEDVLRRDPNHIGANHYYIHAVEASKDPSRALPSASRLGGLAPASGHLVHMPSHIYIRTGEYDKAAESNIAAIAADRNYIAKSGGGGVYPLMYFNHNLHFLASANAMRGRFADAIKAARELEASVNPHVKMMPPLEMFTPYATLTLVRFRQWDEILKTPRPDGELKITTALWHFARGMAYTGANQTEKAEDEFNLLRAIIRTVPSDATLGNSTASSVLNVAEQMLAGRIAFARGDMSAAVLLLKKAVVAEDAVSYNEPPDWDLPAREVLGGILLMSGRNAEAEIVFRSELAKHPRNGRALFGLAESLKRQNKRTSARRVQTEFERTWETADVKLRVEDLGGIGSSAERGLNNHPAPALRFSDVRLKTGVRLHYAEQGDPNGPPVILLHGYTDSWFSYSRVLPLIDAKYHIYALDQRGHGDSDRPSEGYAVSDFADDVVAFMDAKGITQATIVGHSMGSFVAQRVAATAPRRVRRLVLVATGTTIRNDAVRDLQRTVNALTDPIPAGFVREFQVSTIFQPVPEEFMERVIVESLKSPARVWRAVIEGMLASDSNTPPGRIKTRTLIVWGEQETLFSRAEQEALVAANPNARLKVYTETAHSPHWEKPEQFALDLNGFLRQAGQR